MPDIERIYRQLLEFCEPDFPEFTWVFIQRMTISWASQEYIYCWPYPINM